MSRKLTALAAGGAATAVLVALLQSGGRQERRQAPLEPLDSLICAADGPCEPTWKTFWHPLSNAELSDHQYAYLTGEERQLVVRTMQARLQKLNDAGTVPLLLHIGANDMRKEGEWYKYMLGNFKVPYRLILVEPNTRLLPELTRQAATFGSARAPEIVNVAVCPKSGQDLTLFVPSPEKILADFPVFRALAWLGFIQTGVLSEVASLSFEETSHSLQLLHRLPDIKEEYIDRIPIRCLSPGDLLAELGASARDVASITVDTEGYDAQLVSMFLKSEDFNPAVVMFEWAGHHGNETAKVAAIAGAVTALHARGYEVRKDVENIVARVP